MSVTFDAFETVLECLKRTEATLIGMKQMREYVGKGLGKQMLDSLIEEADSQKAEIKRNAPWVGPSQGRSVSLAPDSRVPTPI